MNSPRPFYQRPNGMPSIGRSNSKRRSVGISMLVPVSNDGQYCVYHLIDPRDGTIFYIGKGTNNRAVKSARGNSGNEAKDTRIRDIEDSGHVVVWSFPRHCQPFKGTRPRFFIGRSSHFIPPLL